MILKAYQMEDIHMGREKSEPKKWTGQFSQQNAEQRCTT